MSELNAGIDLTPFQVQRVDIHAFRNAPTKGGFVISYAVVVDDVVIGICQDAIAGDPGMAWRWYWPKHFDSLTDEPLKAEYHGKVEIYRFGSDLEGSDVDPMLFDSDLNYSREAFLQLQRRVTLLNGMEWGGLLLEGA